MIKQRFKRLLYHYLFPYGGVLLARLLAATYRIRVVDPRNETGVLKSGKRLVYASWHQRAFAGITFFSTRRPIAIIISRSRDGEIAARAVARLGWRPVRGSSSRGGKEALEEIKALGRSRYSVGHIVDGPQGPFGVVKPGLVRIAQHTGLPIVPAVTSAENQWVFNSWDRFMVPKPFSRVIIRFGQPVHVPRAMAAGAFEAVRRQVEEGLKALYEDTDRIWDQPERIRSVYG